ncbi:unnamed protein product [Diamesa tonsa]
MKFISYFLVIFLLKFNPGINADNELERLSSANSFNYFDKVSIYLKQVLLNDDAMNKGYVEILIMDLTLKRDINDLLGMFHHDYRIVVNVISKPLDISMRSFDFVIVVQDFLNSKFDQELFEQFQNDMHNLFSQNYIERSEKYIFINMLETSNEKSFMLSFNLGLVHSLVLQKAVFNLMIIDVYADGTEDLWRPIYENRHFELYKPEYLSLNVTTFTRSKMGEIHGKTYADAFIRSNGNFNGNQRLFDLMDEKISFYAQSYPVSNIFPLKKELQFFVSVLRESGLRDYWVQSEVHENNRDIKEDEIKVLNLNDMQLPFIILGSGLGLSLLVFIFELIVNNIKERRMNRVIYL